MTTTSLGYSLEPPDEYHSSQCATEGGPNFYQCKMPRWRTWMCAPFMYGASKNWCPDCGRMSRRVQGCTCEYLEETTWEI